MHAAGLLSVIIPTYNRADALKEALGALSAQTFPLDRLQVLVVDDGSSDGTREVARGAWPFELCYLEQPHSGGTAARNLGAQHSQGEILVWMDDDIVPEPDALEALADAVRTRKDVVVTATLSPNSGSRTKAVRTDADDNLGLVSIPCTACFSGLLAMDRGTFFAVGMFSDASGIWPNWDDVEFGHRAQLAGYSLWRSTRARAVHKDLSALSLTRTAGRAFNVSVSAVHLFTKYPELRAQLPMFDDKTPIAWREDRPALILRKLARRVSAAPLILESLELAARLAESARLPARVTGALRRWVIGGYISRGYRKGLTDSRERAVKP